ncbi:MAG: aldose 1-epimerase family protein [Lachnospiraceae bacterium]|nr:aldose 1-epimerase family protein [Lachnospiraceae bacterium]
MYITIENETLKAAFNTKGAEMISLILKEDNSEYVWQGNPDIWAKHAPLLFPVIGRLKDNEYTLRGKAYHITNHGFGRDSEFEVLSQKDDSVSFLLTPNELSAQMYPFPFRLQINYTLSGNTLKKEHIVTNEGGSTLYYEIGGHDGYNICLEPEEVMEDYYLDFGALDAIHPLRLDENILILDGTDTIPLKDGKLNLRMELFKVDALMLRKPGVDQISLRSRKSGRYITFAFHDFPTIGIWTKYKPFNTNYICFEPWSTLPDCAYLGKELEKKVDIRTVEPGEKDVLSFSVTVGK